MVQSTQFESFKEALNKFIGDNRTTLYQQFLLYEIGIGWKKIAGKLSEHCRPNRIDKTRLIIAVDNAPLANQLFMVKQDLLKKVNTFLKGKYVFLDMSFISGAVLRNFNVDETIEEQVEIKYIKCPICGCKMDSRLIKCFNCLREEKTNSEIKLQKEFVNAPWLTLNDIQLPQIDKLTFNRIHENIASVYYERVRKGIANDFDKIQAVLFYTKKKPAEISQQESEQILAILANDERIKE